MHSADLGAGQDPDPAARSNGAVWPRICSVADLGRILVSLHGANAPSEASLKKWSAAGEFRGCLATESISSSGKNGGTDRGAAGYAKPGRPGLQLLSDKAIARVYELWPQLGNSDPKAIFEEAVARTVRQLASAMAPLAQPERAPVPALSHPLATAASAVAGAPTPAATSDWQQRIDQALGELTRDVRDLRREMAQFSSMRNNLITRLDEVVARSREVLLAAGRPDGGGSDPIVEARRDRDMGVIKSTMEQILSALERLEHGR